MSGVICEKGFREVCKRNRRRSSLGSWKASCIPPGRGGIPPSTAMVAGRLARHRDAMHDAVGNLVER
eukprot:364446-Chlamydomonas_euryale.AAC.6